MTLAGILVICILTSITNLANSIKCFSCTVTPEYSTNGYEQTFTPSCSNFDGSSAYVVDCSFSTMCSRIISTRYLQNGIEQKTVTLGCAQQKRMQHVLFKGKWKEQLSVEEIYSEDCKTMKDTLGGATKTYCYCRGDLCNSAYKRHDIINAYRIFVPTFIIIKLFF